MLEWESSILIIFMIELELKLIVVELFLSLFVKYMVCVFFGS